MKLLSKVEETNKLSGSHGTTQYRSSMSGLIGQGAAPSLQDTIRLRTLSNCEQMNTSVK